MTQEAITSYDAMGREVSSTDRNTGEVTRITYDFMGRAVETERSLTDQEGKDIVQTETKSYNANGSVTSETSSAGVTTEYHYDNRNRVTIAKEDADDATKTTETSYGYETAVIHTLAGTKTYKDLQVQTTKVNGTVTDKTWTDHAGNAVRSLSSGIYTDHVFTDDGKEIAAVTLGSSTDGEGKISLTLYNKEGKTTHTISQPVVDGDSITTGKDTIINETAYDVNGNESAVTDGNGNVTTYTYDAENRLSKVSVTDKDGKTAVIQQNRYNGDGQRIQKVEGSKTTNYYYQDGVVSYTTDGENSQTSQNLIGTDGNILATQRYGSDHTDYLLYHKDIQGSSTSLVKEDGSADATYRYTDFGETTINGDNKAENEVCYTGGIYDQRTGLYYLNARYYNPEDGGFLTEDAYRGETNEPDTQNLYVYCADNPINYIDSSGNKKKRVDFWNIAFKSNTQNYYAFNQNAPQKYAGYNDLYDVMDWTVGDLVTKKVETTWWRLQFWKGKYGATYVPKISNGCEIGLYYRTIKGNPHWYCAYDRNRRIRMRMSLYVGNRKLFTRDSKTSTDQGKAWWLTAFVFKEDMPGKDIYSKTTLRMTGTLWFPKTGKYAKQMQTLSNKLKKVKELKVKGSSYVRTFSWKGK